MRYTRREIGKLALTALPAAAVLRNPLEAMAQTSRKPNSVVNGVNLGTITYSYRSMPDQGAEAILRYVVDSGISQIEFMGGPVEAYAGAWREESAVGHRRTSIEAILQTVKKTSGKCRRRSSSNTTYRRTPTP